MIRDTCVVNANQLGSQLLKYMSIFCDNNRKQQICAHKVTPQVWKRDGQCMFYQLLADWSHVGTDASTPLTVSYIVRPSM
ncbi:hypothetical protein CGRA01v4_02226 [Colletotrichum graminicola]|nr:hypothetical protein CGRA01v4_02226 [Colletotrichum graminicola]